MKRLTLALLVAAGFAFVLKPNLSTTRAAIAAPPPAFGGLIMSKTCESSVLPGATVNCTFTVTNRNTDPGSDVSLLLVQNTDPQGVTTSWPCLQGGSPVDELQHRGSPLDTCTGSFTETAWTCDNPTLFRDHLFADGYDSEFGPVSGEAFWTVNITACTPTITPSITLTPSQTPTPTPTALPDLAPATRPGWSGPVIVTSMSGGLTDTPPYLTTQPLFTGFAANNIGIADAGPSFLVTMYLDSAPILTLNCNPGCTPFPNTPGVYLYYDPTIPLGTLSAGVHEAKVVVNSSFSVAESNYANNTYINTFTVLAPTATITQTPTVTRTPTQTPTGTITPPTLTPTVTSRVPITVPFHTGTATFTPTVTRTGTITPPTTTRTPSITPSVTPTPGAVCGGAITVAVTGATSSARFVSNTYTATASGGTGPYRYWWSCDWNIQAPVFVPGTSKTKCLFPRARNYIVEVRVHDAGVKRGYCGVGVAVGP